MPDSGKLESEHGKGVTRARLNLICKCDASEIQAGFRWVDRQTEYHGGGRRQGGAANLSEDRTAFGIWHGAGILIHVGQEVKVAHTVGTVVAPGTVLMILVALNECLRCVHQ